jgi:two-component system, NtrC family, nitrogen regulation sensor histidine kinase NtrY
VDADGADRGGWLGFAAALRERVVFPLQTLANLLGALREGDFSIRGRAPRPTTRWAR